MESKPNLTCASKSLNEFMSALCSFQVDCMKTILCNDTITYIAKNFIKRIHNAKNVGLILRH